MNVKFLISVVVLWLCRRISGLLELHANIFQGKMYQVNDLLSDGSGKKRSLYCICFQDKNLSPPTIKISEQKQQ